VRAAQELLGVPTIDGGSNRPGGGGGGSQRSHISLSTPKTQFFTQKFLTKYIPKKFLWNTLILKFFIT
jgi:hypothetical protein